MAVIPPRFDDVRDPSEVNFQLLSDDDLEWWVTLDVPDAIAEFERRHPITPDPGGRSQ